MEALGWIVWIAFLFVPVLLLLCAGWFFVRYQNEHDDEAVRHRNQKVSRRCLLATVIAAAVLFGLHLLFPMPV